MATQASAQQEAPERTRHRFTVDEYERIVEIGVLAGLRVELIDGEVLDVSAMNAAHARSLEYLHEELQDRLPRREYVVRQQTPLAIPPRDMPEPDIMVLHRRSDRYAGRFPGPADVLLVIEVSDTTYRTDRGRKLAIYARGGVPDLWIADLAGVGNGGVEGVERHADPDPGTGEYRSFARFGRGEQIASAGIPGLTLPVEEILGPPALRVEVRS